MKSHFFPWKIPHEMFMNIPVMSCYIHILSINIHGEWNLSIKKSIKANANIHENGISCYLPLTSPHSHRTTASRSSCDSKVSRCRKPKRRSKIARADWWCQTLSSILFKDVQSALMGRRWKKWSEHNSGEEWIMVDDAGEWWLMMVRSQTCAIFEILATFHIKLVVSYIEPLNGDGSKSFKICYYPIKGITIWINQLF